MLASLPLLLPGLPDTHDGLFHYYRLMALREAIRAGCAYPLWFPSFAYGYGQPVLAFYSPNLYYLGAGVSLTGLSGLCALKITIWLGFLFSGLAAYGLARKAMSEWAAALVGSAYVLFPYRLANVYIRGAFAEHWGLALVPLVLLLTERACRGRRTALVELALGWAALILTHNLSAFVLAPLWVVYLWTADRSHVLSQRLKVASALPVAAGLTAFYWLPIPWASRLVGLGNTFSTDAWRRLLVPWSEVISRSLAYAYFPNQGVAHEYPLSLVATLVAGLAVAVVLLARRMWHRRLRSFLIWLVVLLFLQLDVSAPVWAMVPGLGFVQFPWRLLGPFALAWAWLLGVGLDRASALCLRSRGLVGVTALGAVLTVAATSLWNLPRETISVPEERDWVQHMWQHDFEIGQVGATWTAEYVPVWVTVDRSAMPLDPVESDKPPRYNLPTGAEVRAMAAGRCAYELWVNLPAAARLSWHAFYFPGWRVLVDGEDAEAKPFTDLGLLSVDVGPGEHVVRIAHGQTPLRVAARLISVLSLMLVLLLGVSRARILRAVIVSLLAGGLCWLATDCADVPERVADRWVPFEDQLALVGWQVETAELRPGGQAGVELYWVALSTPTEDYKVFVHLVDEKGQVAAQSDGDPVGGFTPTRRLVGGEMFCDRRVVALPRELPPGRYAIYAGLYRWPEIANLRVSSGPLTGAERVILGHVEVGR